MPEEMVRLLVVLALFAALVPLVLDSFGGNPLDPRLEGRQVLVHADEFDVRFDRIGDLSESYMLFGGTDGEMHNSFTNVYAAGLAMRHARLIAARYPDFHKCKSPGAPKAQKLTESLAFVAADGPTRRTLLKAVELHDESIAKGADRVCISLEGDRLSLDSVVHRAQAIDMTAEITGRMSQTGFYFVRKAEIAECQSLL